MTAMPHDATEKQATAQARLNAFPKQMDARDDVPPIQIPDAWLTTKPGLPFPWNGAFLKWQEELRDQPR
jgi:hypothetical protein